MPHWSSPASSTSRHSATQEHSSSSKRPDQTAGKPSARQFASTHTKPSATPTEAPPSPCIARSNLRAVTPQPPSGTTHQPHSQRRRGLTLSSGPLDGDRTRPQRSFGVSRGARQTVRSTPLPLGRATRLANLAPVSRALLPRHRPYLTDVDATRTFLSRRLRCASRLAFVAAGYRIVMI
jgi:hypothetical protein